MTFSLQSFEASCSILLIIVISWQYLSASSRVSVKVSGNSCPSNLWYLQGCDINLKSIWSTVDWLRTCAHADGNTWWKNNQTSRVNILAKILKYLLYIWLKSHFFLDYHCVFGETPRVLHPILQIIGQIVGKQAQVATFQRIWYLKSGVKLFKIKVGKIASS